MAYTLSSLNQLAEQIMRFDSKITKAEAFDLAIKGNQLETLNSLKETLERIEKSLQKKNL